MSLISCSVVMMAASAALVPAQTATAPIRRLAPAHPAYTAQQIESYMTADQVGPSGPGSR